MCKIISFGTSQFRNGRNKEKWTIELPRYINFKSSLNYTKSNESIGTFVTFATDGWIAITSIGFCLAEFIASFWLYLKVISFSLVLPDFYIVTNNNWVEMFDVTKICHLMICRYIRWNSRLIHEHFGRWFDETT